MANKTSKEVIIAMRNALKAGVNLPLKAYGDNVHVAVDESLAFAFTVWDDDNGVLYFFRLMDVDQSQSLANVRNQSISVAAIKYEFIQVMEVAPMPISKIHNICSTIKSNSSNITLPDEFVDHMEYVFTRALSDKTADILPSDINAAHGAYLMNDDDQYYSGRFKEPYKETHTPEILYRNQRLAAQRAAAEAEEQSSQSGS